MQALFYDRRRFIAITAATAICPALSVSALPARAAETEAVTAPIQRLNNGLLDVMKAGGHASFEQRFDMLAPVIDQTFDLPTILQESVGFTWSSMQPAQQSMLAEAFRRYTVASYVNSFDSYDGQRFEISPDVRAVGTNEQVVQTRIIPRSGAGHELNYVMREGAGGWRAVDVLADGSISRVAVQRSDFRRLLSRGGPDALAQSLRTKSVDLSAGTD